MLGYFLQPLRRRRELGSRQVRKAGNMKKWISTLAVGLFALHAAAALAAPNIHVLILDGESAAPYHNWKAETPVLKAELDETGLFDTDVLTAPSAGGDFSQF